MVKRLTEVQQLIQDKVHRVIEKGNGIKLYDIISTVKVDEYFLAMVKDYDICTVITYLRMKHLVHCRFVQGEIDLVYFNGRANTSKSTSFN